MSEEIDYASRVQRGAALLDEKWPTWAQDIDLEKLNIESGTACMTAQYAQQHGAAADWYVGKDMLGLGGFAYQDHGFRADAGGGEDAAYDALNRLWRDLITERRSAAQPEASAR